MKVTSPVIARQAPTTFQVPCYILGFHCENSLHAILKLHKLITKIKPIKALLYRLGEWLCMGKMSCSISEMQGHYEDWMKSLLSSLGESGPWQRALVPCIQSYGVSTCSRYMDSLTSRYGGRAVSKTTLHQVYFMADFMDVKLAVGKSFSWVVLAHFLAPPTLISCKPVLFKKQTLNVQKSPSLLRSGCSLAFERRARCLHQNWLPWGLARLDAFLTTVACNGLTIQTIHTLFDSKRAELVFYL